MCGILGVLPPIHKNDFLKSLDTLSHRGPDDYGIYENQDILLGHKRLSIVDLSDGHQPMGYGELNQKEKRYWIVFNGEIYNYIEIKNELIAKGYVFHTHSDTEVVLAAYDCWKEDCLQHFNGMWALAIWDNLEKDLFLSRDRFGKKPLFYAFVKNKNGETHFVFASEMKAIYPYLREIRPSKDFQYLSDIHHIFSVGQTQETIIEGIYRFPHSHYAYYQPQQIEIKPIRYYDILDHIHTSNLSYQDAIKKFERLFFDCVYLRTKTDVPFGMTLSGGVDSSSVVSAVSHLQKQSKLSQQTNIFVACFKDTPQDEREYAKKVAENTNITTHYLEINPLDEWENLEYYFYMLEELYGRCLIAHIATYKAIRNAGFSVVLDGHGSDEMLCGYGHQSLAINDCIFNPNAIIDTLKIQDQVIGKNSTNIQLLYQGYLSIIKTMIKKICFPGKLSYRDVNHPSFQKLDFLGKTLYHIFYQALLPINLRDYDKCSMIHSVEIRMPFMDHRLVEFLFSLPSLYKNNEGYTKKILRDAMKPYMPHEVLYRKNKIGFNAPMVQWIQKSYQQNGVREWFLDTINSQEFLQCPLVSSPSSIKENICSIIQGNQNSSRLAEEVWCALNPFLWQQSLKKYALKSFSI